MADRRVEAVDVPFNGKALRGWLHFPAVRRDNRAVPVIVNISGMDGYKEATIALYGDRFLNQGCAVLALEGPGQYEAALDEIYASTQAWAETGRACVDYLATRPELDARRIGIVGRSFGSFFSTIAFAHEPRLAACAVTGTVLQPGCHAIFEQASPTFKRRFMYMAGYTEEAGFDAFAKTLTWEAAAAKISAPYLCVTGEFDQLSPLVHTEDLFQQIKAPKQLVIYQGADHTVSGVPAAMLGPYSPSLMAEWMRARLAGIPFPSQRLYVDGAGKVTVTPYA